MLYNISSLLLGLAAWLFAVISIHHSQKFQTGSFICCATSLCLQFLELRRLCEIGDISAVLDTIGGVTFAAIVLTTVTVLINLYAQFRRRNDYD